MVKSFARMAGRMSNNDDVQQAKLAKSQHGEFFAVDWRCVEEATRYGDGTNTAVAYIALASPVSKVPNLAPNPALLGSYAGACRGRGRGGLA